MQQWEIPEEWRIYPFSSTWIALLKIREGNVNIDTVNGIETILYDTLSGIKVIYVFKDFHPLGGYKNYISDEMYGKT